MRRAIILFISLFANKVNANPIIKNNNIPACRNCKFFTPINYNQFDSDMNRCAKFGEKNIITGEIDYEFVSSCRKNEEKCGFE